MWYKNYDWWNSSHKRGPKHSKLAWKSRCKKSNDDNPFPWINPTTSLYFVIHIILNVFKRIESTLSVHIRPGFTHTTHIPLFQTSFKPKLQCTFYTRSIKDLTKKSHYGMNILFDTYLLSTMENFFLYFDFIFAT